MPKIHISELCAANHANAPHTARLAASRVLKPGSQMRCSALTGWSGAPMLTLIAASDASAGRVRESASSVDHDGDDSATFMAISRGGEPF